LVIVSPFDAVTAPVANDFGCLTRTDIGEVRRDAPF
jgi:hypothetical protein